MLCFFVPRKLFVLIPSPMGVFVGAGDYCAPLFLRKCACFPRVQNKSILMDGV